jgi:hypothetical protein
MDPIDGPRDVTAPANRAITPGGTEISNLVPAGKSISSIVGFAVRRSSFLQREIVARGSVGRRH